MRKLKAFVVLLVLLSSASANAFIIEGVEITDWLSIDVAPGANIILSTSQDVYVFAPLGVTAVDLTVSAPVIVFLVPIVADVIDLCSIDICPPAVFDESLDLYVSLPPVVGSLTILAEGSVVIGMHDLPAPSLLTLVLVGCLAARRLARGCS